MAIDVVKVLVEAEPPKKRGRPSEYTDEVLDIINDYIEHHEGCGDPVPTIEGLAYILGTGKQTIYTWERAQPEFQDALDRLRAKQGKLLQAQGLIGKFAPVITKLMLSANHGMREGTDVTSKGEQLGTADAVIAAISAQKRG